MLAHPPPSLDRLVGKRAKLPEPVVRLLGEIGDVRGLGVLRRQLRRDDRAVQQAAALALVRLGDGRAVELGRRWARAPAKASTAREAAAEILVLAGSPDASEAVIELIRRSRTRPKGLELALRAPSPRLLPALRAVLEAGEAAALPSERELALRAVGHIGTSAAAQLLLDSLAAPELAARAAFELAAMPSEAAHDRLERALANAAAGAERRLLLRAGIARFVELEQALAGLEPSLERALGSKEASDRAVGSLGLALLGRVPLGELVRSTDPVVRRAAARAALVLGPQAVAQCAPLVRTTGDGEPSLDAVAGGLSLLAGRSEVSTALLARWAEGGGALAPVAAMVLARRDSPMVRSRLEGLLGGTDPVIRAHAALGLAHSPKADATSLLTAAYRFEEDPMVRRAIVRALSLRPERLRRRTLELARELDSDSATRALARSALGGRRLAVSARARGSEVAWLALEPNRPSEQHRAAGRAARLIRSDGLALPVVTDPDGGLLVPGLGCCGAVSLQLAPAAVSGDARP